MVIIGGGLFLMSEVTLCAQIKAAFSCIIRRKPPSWLRYCLSWGLWIVHTRLIQTISLKVDVWIVGVGAP